MKRIIFLSLIIFCSAIYSSNLWSQEKYLHCSSAKTNGFNKKSPLLSSIDISQQEKYDVTFYQIDLKMSNTTTYLEGSATIKGKTVQNTDTLLLELFESFDIDSIILNGNNVSFNHTGFILKIPANLNANGNFSTTIYYHGTPPSEATNPLGGSGLSHALVNAWNTEVTWSLSEPFLAYEWFPVKQILSDKADSCVVNITVSNDLKVGSNGILENISDNGNGTSTYHWFHRHPIAYYLISVAVSDYEEYTVNAFVGTPNEMPIINYIYPNSLSDYKNDIDETVDFIELYSDLYGLYPFADEKYGHCLAPIGGGMEHQTMTTQSTFTATLTAHELAHQWFGDYVTCNSWSEVWLNEGFASYSEDLMIEYLHPGQEISYMTSRHNKVKSQPGGSVWVKDSTSDADIFSSRLTYEKGAAIINTLRYIINNDSLFFNGLRTYLQTHKNSTASISDFKTIMENVANIQLDDFFNQWYFGEGFPSYKITWNGNDDNLLIRVQQSTSTTITPLFTTPLELKVSRYNNLPDTIIKIDIPSNDFTTLIDGFENVKNIVRIDPNAKVICKVISIIKDNDLTSNAKIQELQSTPSFKVYPIPADDFITIEASNQGEYSFELIDDFGRIIQKNNFKNQYQIETKNLAKGDYIIKITNDKSKGEVYKIIKL